MREVFVLLVDGFYVLHALFEDRLSAEIVSIDGGGFGELGGLVLFLEKLRVQQHDCFLDR